jgi:hypothetical protein
MEFSVDKHENPIYTMHPLWPYPVAITAIRKKRQGGPTAKMRAGRAVFSRRFGHASNNMIDG